MEKKRYQLCTQAEGIGYVSRLIDAQDEARYYATELHENVRIHDRYAHAGTVDLWLMKPAIDHLYPIRMKLKAA